MSTRAFNTRVLLKYDSYANWIANNPKLMKGELAVAAIPSGNTQTVNSVTPPQLLIKVGDGEHNYSDLPFASGLAADVYSWAKASTKPSYTYNEVGADEAGAAAAAEAAANAYTDEAIAGISGTDTLYRIVVTGTTMKLQSKERQEDDSKWADVSGQSWNLNTVLKGSIASGNTGFVVGGDIFNALGEKQDNLVFDGTYDATTNKVATVSTVNTAVTAEANRAAQAESDLADDIAAEETRATGAEEDLAADIAAEETRATGVEAGLRTDVDAAAAAVEAEESRAKGAEEALDGRLDTVEAKPAFSITSTQISNWDGEVGAKAAVTAEETRAKGAEEDLADDITAEETRAKGAEEALADDIADEASRAAAAEAQVLVDAKAYTDQEVSKIVTISYEIVDELPTAGPDYDFNVHKVVYLVSEGAGKEKDYYGEYICVNKGTSASPNYVWEKIGDTRIDLTEYRKAADQDLIDASIRTLISDEYDRASQAESDLGDRIDGVSDDLDTEAATARAAEQANATAISNEVTRATGVEATKADKVDSAVAGHFAGLDANGNLTDSGKKAADFDIAGAAAAAEASAKSYTDSEILKLDSSITGLVSGEALTGITITDGKISAHTKASFDPAGSAAAAETAAKAYADGLDAAMDARVDALEAMPGLDKVGTVTSVAAGLGLKVTGTASVNPTVDFDDDCVFVFNCGDSTDEYTYDDTEY